MEEFIKKIVEKLAEQGLVVLLLGGICYYLVDTQKDMWKKIDEDRIESDRRFIERISSLEENNRKYHRELIECLQENGR